MKKRLTLLTICTLAVFLFGLIQLPISARAATSGASPNGLVWELDDEGTLTILGNAKIEDSPIPWGNQRQEVKRIVIKDGVTGIGNSVFAGYYDVQSVEIPGSVKVVGKYAFDECFALTEVKLAHGVEILDDYAFNACAMPTIQLPDTLHTIGKQVFSNNGALQQITIPEGVESVGLWAFAACPKLTSVSIPKSATTLDSGLFHLCPALRTIQIHPDNPSYVSVNNVLYNKDKTLLHTVGRSNSGSFAIPGTVKTIEEYAFEDCTQITALTIPDSITSLLPYVFAGCSGLIEVVWPASIPAIEEYTFTGCSGLKRIVLPNTLKSIGHCAFSGCASLTAVEIPESITSIGYNVFNSCKSLKEVKLPSNLRGVSNGMFRFCTSLTSITLPEGVTYIGDYAFGNTALTQITLPKSVSTVTQGAFANCSDLKAVTFTGNAPFFHKISFDSTTTTIFYPKNNTTWTAEKMQNYGGTLSWKSGTPCEGGHSFGQWQMTLAPTCTTSGKQTAYCEYCGHARNQTIPTAAHQYTTSVVDPTCTESGYTLHTCEDCGHHYKDADTAVADHSYSQWLQIKAPTATEDGLEQRVCANCDAKEQRPLAKTDSTPSLPDGPTPEDPKPEEPKPEEPKPEDMEPVDSADSAPIDLAEPQPPHAHKAANNPKTESNSNHGIALIAVVASIALGGAITFIVLKKKK